MIHRFVAYAAVAAALVVGAATPASAQEYWRRLDTAQRVLNGADREERFELAATRCRETIQQRRAEWMVIWCDLAANAAMRQRNAEHRDTFSDDERALLWDAAWLQALEGIQQGGFFVATPLVERVSIADADSSRRLVAYRLMSNLRSRDYRDIEAYMRQLAGIDGVTITPQESLLVGRRRLIDALLAQPRTPERLWAIAAAALTFELEYRSTEVTRDNVLVDAREVAQAIAGLSAEAEGFEGQDAALAPLLLYAQAKVLWVGQDYLNAERVAKAGFDACVTRLWHSASLCLDLGMDGGLAALLGELTAANPEQMALPPEPPLSSRNFGTEYTETRCRVIIVGDADDAGQFVNARVVYDNPPGVCRAMALRYANARSYRPIASAITGARRQNIVIRFVLTSP